MRYLLLLLILCGCAKEETEFYSVRLPIEGDYYGQLLINGKTVQNTLIIRNINGEELFTRTLGVNASAYLNGNTYHYVDFYYQLNPCSSEVALMTGTGVLNGDTITEHGTFFINNRVGKWSAKMVR